jgi:hypothetical protein
MRFGAESEVALRTSPLFGGVFFMNGEQIFIAIEGKSGCFTMATDKCGPVDDAGNARSSKFISNPNSNTS